jgi:hypothetical protein
MGSTARKLWLDTGTWTLTSNVTLPATQTLWIPTGTTLNINTTIALTLNGHLHIEPGGQLCTTGTGAVTVVGALQLPPMQVFCNGAMVHLGTASVANGVNPRWWGALGDGSHIDRPAIQAAHDAMPDAGGVLRVSMGIYVFDGPLLLSKGVTLQGDGMTGDVVCCDDTTLTGTAFKFTTTTGDDIRVSASNGWAIKDLTIFHPYAADPVSGVSIHVLDSTFNNNFFAIRNVTLSNVRNGIAVDRGSNCTIDNVRIFNARDKGVWLRNIPNADAGTCHVTNVLVATMGNVAGVNDFTPSATSSGFYVEVGDFWCFHCNTVGPMQVGMTLDLSSASRSTGNVFIVGSSLEAYVTNGILMSRFTGTNVFRNINITGNEIGSNPGQGSSGINIAPGGGFAQVTISGNVLLGDDTLIKLQSGEDITVVGNTMVDAALGLQAGTGVTVTYGPNTLRGVGTPFAGGNAVLYSLTTPVTLGAVPGGGADGSLLTCTNCGPSGAACIVLYKGGTAMCQ